MELADIVHGSTIGSHVSAEINLSRFIRGVTLDLKDQAAALVTLIEECQATIHLVFWC